MISAGYLRCSGDLESHDDGDAACDSDDERPMNDEDTKRTTSPKISISSPRARNTGASAATIVLTSTHMDASGLSESEQIVLLALVGLLARADGRYGSLSIT